MPSELRISPAIEGAAMSMIDAAKWLAAMTGGPRPHAHTVLRWATKGIRGQRLRAERIGGRWFVTPQALAEFHRRINQEPEGGHVGEAGDMRRGQVQAAVAQLRETIKPRGPGRKGARR
jgi:hypothetical protein